MGVPAVLGAMVYVGAMAFVTYVALKMVHKNTKVSMEESEELYKLERDLRHLPVYGTLAGACGLGFVLCDMLFGGGGCWGLVGVLTLPLTVWANTFLVQGLIPVLYNGIPEEAGSQRDPGEFSTVPLGDADSAGRMSATAIEELLDMTESKLALEFLFVQVVHLAVFYQAGTAEIGAKVEVAGCAVYEPEVWLFYEVLMLMLAGGGLVLYRMRNIRPHDIRRIATVRVAMLLGLGVPIFHVFLAVPGAISNRSGLFVVFFATTVWFAGAMVHMYPHAPTSTFGADLRADISKRLSKLLARKAPDTGGDATPTELSFEDFVGGEKGN